MHLALIVCTSLWFGATPTETPESAPAVSLAVVVEQLGSNRFKEREAAMQQLWAAGESAVPLLEQGLSSKSAEVRYRARYVLDNLRAGITHDTPASVLREIYRFRSDLVEQRRQAMQRLEASGRPRIVLALLQSETDPRLRDEWSQALERSLTRSIVQGQLDEVSDTLRRSLTSDTWHRHWAAFACQLGILDAELARSASTDADLEIVRQRIFLLRAKGALPEAAHLAVEVSSDLHFVLLGELHDWKQAAPLAAARLESGSETSEADAERLAIAAAYSRLAGRPAEADRYLARIKSQGEKILARLADVEPTYYQTQRELTNRNWHFAKGLLLNGRYDDAMELMRAKQTPFVFELLCEQHRFEEAFAAVDADLLQGPDPDWFRAIAVESAGSQETIDQRLTVGLFAARQLAFLGRRDEAISSLSILLESARNDRTSRRLQMICETAVKLSANELALDIAASIMDMEDSAGALAILYPSRTAVATVWWEYFRGLGAESIRQSLQRVDNVLRPQLATMPQEFEALVENASARVDGLSEAKKVEWWQALGETCQMYHCEPLAISLLTKAAQSSPEAAIQLGDIFARQQKWSIAATWYHSAWQLSRNKPLPLYLHARALQQSGEQEKGSRLAELALLMPMGNAEVRHGLASGLKERGFRDEALGQFELILRTGDFQDGRLIDAAKQIGNLVHAKDALRAADCWETMLLSCLKPHWVFVEKGGYIQIPHLVHKTRARGLLNVGKHDLAVEEVWASFRAAPANSELAEELVPLLKAAKREQDANELFERSANRLQELIESFPQCATFHNNLAWLYVRCDGDLTKALEHAQRALELESNRTIFIDTLGEVHFRLGHYDQAIACAERCVKAEPNSSYYQGQFERFRRAKKG